MGSRERLPWSSAVKPRCEDREESQTQLSGAKKADWGTRQQQGRGGWVWPRRAGRAARRPGGSAAHGRSSVFELTTTESTRSNLHLERTVLPVAWWRGRRSRRGRRFTRPRPAARCAGGVRRDTWVGLSGNSPGPLPGHVGAPGCGHRSPFQRLSQKGCGVLLSQSWEVGDRHPGAVARILSALATPPEDLGSLGPLGRPEATPLYTSYSPSRR